MGVFRTSPLKIGSCASVVHFFRGPRESEAKGHQPAEEGEGLQSSRLYHVTGAVSPEFFDQKTPNKIDQMVGSV